MIWYIVEGAVALVAVVIAFILGSSHRKRTAEAAIGSAEDEARRILNDAMKNAEAKKKEAILEAKDEIIRSRNETEKDALKEHILSYKQINEREKEIMVMRFGLYGGDEFTQKEVADSLGISQSYISRLEK